MTRPLPVLFVSHGSPMVLLDDDEYTRALAGFGAGLTAPRGIVVVSAHWEAAGPVRVTSSSSPEQIRDFGGFPEALYNISYAPPGDPGLARQVLALLQNAGVEAVPDPSRGLDHGVWVPLRFAFPRAMIPVVAVSLRVDMSPEDRMAMGGALAPLRRKGVLLVGSGGVVHNLGRLAWQSSDAEGEAWAPDAPVDGWAREFDDWVRARVEMPDVKELTRYRRDAPHADLAVPTAEHFDPLFFALGARGPADRVIDLYRGFRHGSLSMATFQWTET